MTVVQIDVEWPGRATRAHRDVLVTLMDGGAGGAAGGRLIGDTRRVRLDADGHAEVDLVPSAEISPPGTCYRLTVDGAQPSLTRHIEVPDVGPVSWADPAIQVLTPVPPDMVPVQVWATLPGSIDGGSPSSVYTPPGDLDGGAP